MDKMKTFFKKRWVLLVFGVAVIFIGAIIYAKAPAKMILFYSDSCPHCKNVEAYMDQNGIREKMKFEEREVSQDRNNAALLEQKARQCNLDLSQGIGVPFFFDGQQCLMGDEPIIEYFKDYASK